jgi:CDGSH-type Zn-finger protein
LFAAVGDEIKGGKQAPPSKRRKTMAEPLVIRCRENGPLVLQGPIKIVDHLGNEFTILPGKDTVALCRCGQSRNKPFCDGSHRQCGFVAGEIAKPREESSAS